MTTTLDVTQKSRAQKKKAWRAVNLEKNRALGRAKTKAWRCANKEKNHAQTRARYAANPEKARARSKAWRAANPEKYRAQIKARRAANPETNRAQMKARYAADPEKARAVSRAWYHANRSKALALTKAYQSANPDKLAANNLRRRTAKRQARPAWADQRAIAAVYRDAAQRRLTTGVRWVVDHIYPLRGRTVSGLHVHQNLRIITSVDNARKGNRFPEAMA